MENLIPILISSIFIQNICLYYILGMCPYIALSRSLKTAFGMGVAVIFVVVLTAVINWPVYYLILVPLKLEFLSFIIFIVVIAATVQLVEMIMEKFFPALQSSFGIFLPLITVNCIVLAVSVLMQSRAYNFITTLVFAVGCSVGYCLAIVLVAAISEKLDLVGDIPKGLKGPGIIILITGIIAMAFLGFSGIV